MAYTRLGPLGFGISSTDVIATGNPQAETAQGSGTADSFVLVDQDTGCTPQGPGFLMFFQVGDCTPSPSSAPKGLHGGNKARRQSWTEHDGDWYPKKKPVIEPEEEVNNIEQLLREDNEILDVIIKFVTKGQTE